MGPDRFRRCGCCGELSLYQPRGGRLWTCLPNPRARARPAASDRTGAALEGAGVGVVRLAPANEVEAVG